MSARLPLKQWPASLWLAFVLAVLFALGMILPLAWLVRSSLMELGQIFIFPPQWIPDPFAWSNYPDALTTIPFLHYLWNTLVILVPTVIGTVLTTTMAAFGFSRLEWPGRDAVFNILLATLMLPFVTTLIPTFLWWSKMGLTNTPWPLVVPHWFGADVFFIFLLRQFFRTIPRELDDAAILDGANPLQVLWHVIVPLSKPALITVAILSGLASWNDFLDPLIYLQDSSQFTLALGLSEFTGLYTSQWHLLMAAATVVVVPVLVLFFLAQRYFVESITLSGIKG
ncbi:MAG TPA: carbohydrate ABC transporter permease [Kaistia sp.]|nr:carbohydrate ABC transporter permease [Kaistia sp.]